MSMTSSRRRPGCPLALAGLLLAFARVAAAQSAGPPTQPAEPVARPVPEAAAPAAAPAQPPQSSPARRNGHLYTWGSVGTTFAYGQTYGSASLGAGWLMPDGIAPNVELGYAFGNSPTLWSLRPGVIWYLPLPLVRPYVGVHYTHWFVGGGQGDQDGVGGRAGLSLGRVLTLGIVYDHALGCSQNCDSWAPQISAGLAL